MDSKLKYFIDKLVLITTKVRSKDTIFSTGGYMVAYDKQFIYLAAEDREVKSAIAINAIVDITAMTEDELRAQALEEAEDSDFGGMN